MSEGALIAHSYIMRQSAFRKLMVALSNGSMTTCQRTKIYDHNFDEFFTKPILKQFEQQGTHFLGDVLKLKDPANIKLPPLPDYTAPTNSWVSLSAGKMRDVQLPAMEKKEKEGLAAILFPDPPTSI